MEFLKTSATWLRLLEEPGYARAPSDPRPGYYKTQWAKGCPWVAAQIWGHRYGFDDDWSIYCYVGDEQVPVQEWWPKLTAITKEGFDDLTARREIDPIFASYKTPVNLQEDVIWP